MPDETSERSLESRRKRLIFRSWHRGTREIDLIMGNFADRFVPAFGETEVALYEELLDLPDLDVYDWLIFRVPVPPERDNTVTRHLLDFVRTSKKI
jgi:antitoxin CptB